ncbi:hypothetical protein HYDPIDRAFT_67948, partial [Hydnomerulius pinastri MD-312]
KEMDRLLEWLGGLDCTSEHEDICSLRQPGTCQWLPATEMFNSWRSGAISFLWLKGRVGTGKSILASAVIEDLRESRDIGEALAFFYCDFRNERSMNAAEVLRSLLAQLLRDA